MIVETSKLQSDIAVAQNGFTFSVADLTLSFERSRNSGAHHGRVFHLSFAAGRAADDIGWPSSAHAPVYPIDTIARRVTA